MILHVFCGGWLMPEKMDQAYPNKSACGKGIPEKMIKTCTVQAVQPPLISQCAWLLSSYKQIRKFTTNLHDKHSLWKIREQIQSQLCIPSIVLCHTCCLKYPNTTNLKKTRNWNYQTFCTFWKNIWPLIQYVRIYIYICICIYICIYIYM